MDRLHALGMKDSDVYGGSADLVPALQILLFLFRCILIVILDVITLPSVIFFLPLIYITAKVSASLYEGEDERGDVLLMIHLYIRITGSEKEGSRSQSRIHCEGKYIHIIPSQSPY